MILLPGDLEFELTLGAILPPGWEATAAQSNGNFAFVARAGSGLLEAVAADELDDYIEGGEYDERLSEIGEVGDDC